MGGDDDGNDAENQRLQEQIDQQNAELETKRKSLYDERLRIIKSQGAENWTPQTPNGVASAPMQSPSLPGLQPNDPKAKKAQPTL